jgi:hypothetical protein
LKYASEEVKKDPEFVVELLKEDFPNFDVALVDGKVIVTVPEGVTEIAYDTFSRKSGFNKVVLPSTLLDMPCAIFYCCFDLEEIEIPSGVKLLPGQAFEGCVNLKKVVLNEGLERISWGVFANTPALETLNIPSTVISLGDGYQDTFESCYLSPFATMYGTSGSGIRKADIEIACPERFNDECFRGTKED